MKQHHLHQSTPEWHAYRSRHYNASDASAMLGLSSYKSRTQLLHEAHTGLTPEIDAATQRRFDAGHAAEAAARQHAEQIIGDDLYPIVGSLDVDGLPLSASFDGLTMDECVTWEHKLLNGNLAESLANGIIPEQYHPQIEQQLLVSGAEKALFMASNGTKESALWAWYESSPELRQQIIAGWKQFDADLQAYKLPEQQEVKPIGVAPENLPALRIEVTGMVTASNLAAFKAHALAVFEGINRTLESDQDFADAERTVKWCSEVEDRLKAAKQHALSQTESIDALFNTIDAISAEAKAVRLELDKLIKLRKESIRTDIVMQAKAALADHVQGLDKRIGRPLMPEIAADFAGVIKGKKNIDSMQDAVNTVLANAKVEANQIAERISVNLIAINGTPETLFLFPDLRAMVLKDPADLAEIIQARTLAHQQRVADIQRRAEADQQRIEAEVQARRAAQQAQAQVQAITLPAAENQPCCAADGVCTDACSNSLQQAQPPIPENIAPILGELNALLVRLNGAQLERILHFVQSRFAQELGLDLDAPQERKKSPGYRTSGPRRIAA